MKYLIGFLFLTLILTSCKKDPTSNNEEVITYDLFVHQSPTRFNYFIEEYDGSERGEEFADTSSGFIKVLNVSNLEDITVSNVQDSTGLDDREYAIADLSDVTVLDYVLNENSSRYEFRKNIKIGQSYSFTDKYSTEMEITYNQDRVSVPNGFYDTEAYTVTSEYTDGPFGTYDVTEEFYFEKGLGIVKYIYTEIDKEDSNNQYSKVLQLKSIVN